MCIYYRVDARIMRIVGNNWNSFLPIFMHVKLDNSRFLSEYDRITTFS